MNEQLHLGLLKTDKQKVFDQLGVVRIYIILFKVKNKT